MTIKRGYIYFANLNPTVGSEINKTRPMLVLSNDINNQFSETITVIPITSNTNVIRSFEVFVPKGIANLPKDSKIKCDQIRTIDKSRFINESGRLIEEYIIKAEEALKRHLQL